MTRRAYSPRMTTVDLIAQIMDRPGIARVQTIAPRRGPTFTRPTMLRITLDRQGSNPKPAYSDFTLPDARAWLAAEIAADLRPHETGAHDATPVDGCPLCIAMAAVAADAVR